MPNDFWTAAEVLAQRDKKVQRLRAELMEVKARLAARDGECDAKAGIIARLERERDAQVAAAYEAAAQCCDEYYCVAPTGMEAESLDAQMEHTESCIRALTPADARAALQGMIDKAVAEALSAPAPASGFTQENKGNVVLTSALSDQSSTAHDPQPVAWAGGWNRSGTMIVQRERSDGYGTPLYAHPPAPPPDAKQNYPQPDSSDADLGALVERQRQIARLHRGFCKSEADTLRGPATMSYAEHAALAMDADLAADAITALRARPVGVKVKPLVWDGCRAKSPIGDYIVTAEDWDDNPFWFIIFNGKPASRLGEHKDEESAMAAAQTDYEARIRAVLEREEKA